MNRPRRAGGDCWRASAQARLGRGWIRALFLAGLSFPTASAADRRYFLETYTPYLGPAGETEVELWLTSKTGKQNPAEGATVESRAEMEFGISARSSVAAYLNLVRPPGGPLRVHSGSLELVYRLSEREAMAIDPAAYLEITESGDELELEPKLLLAHRFGKWLAAGNLIGEFEFHHNRDELLANGEVLRNGVAGEIAAGLTYEFDRRLALGVEALGRTEHPNFGAQSAALLALGPDLNVRIGEAQLGVALLRQIRGLPQTLGHRNLVDFERTQLRLVLGLEL